MAAKQSQSKENLEDFKEKFKELVDRAKQLAHDGNLEKSLEFYRKAYQINKCQKVSKRIEKLKRKLKECENSSNTDDDDVDYEDVDGLKLPKKIYNKLYPYQIEGVMWLWKLHKEKKGGILADDMGLGKTIQVISFLSGMFRHGHIKSALIVMTVSLLSNWEEEFEKWAPEIRVLLFHGSNKKQRRKNLVKIQSRNGVCLTTYGLKGLIFPASKMMRQCQGRSISWKSQVVIIPIPRKTSNTDDDVRALFDLRVEQQQRRVLVGRL